MDTVTAITTGKLVAQFKEWLAEAEQGEPNDANAMALATSTPEGRPSVRMVLLKDVDDHGFTFYTNLGSRKAAQLGQNAQAALLFHWKSLRRQVRVEGAVAPVSDAEADAYFATRPRLSQIGAWASKQSQPLEGRFVLERRVAEYTAKFNVGTVPRPDFWSGFRLAPVRIEFWQDRPYRLHDRVIYTLDGDAWTAERQYP
ncbi:MAG: pyridoxamine 5'-phosphate oxidase [Hyphomicrobiales bacterium]|nr:pyridoxamine 5'-phosphate oxidase [Hyphomicrobiales bacterium]MCP5370874.1 pyridoxamine 5'-phosphate oxidase [Hyphomicrobiales bacterium]